MRSVIPFVVGVGASQLAGEPDLSSYSYDQYQVEFGQHVLQSKFGGGDRKAIFDKNLELIRSHNANPSKTWFATVNQFTAMENHEFRSLTKGRKEKIFGGEAQPHKLTAREIPASKDWRDDGVVTPAKDQGGCGSCWAFSAAQTFESMLAIKTGSLQSLSPQQIVSCAPNPDSCGGSGGCQGSTQPLAFHYTQTAGLTTEASYPYQGSTGTCQESKITPVAYNSNYTVLATNDYTGLMDAVGNVGPIAISIAAGGSTFQFYGGGVMSNCNDYVMDHAVQLVGYGTDSSDYWLVRNSWGSSWGESGYIRVQRYGEGKEPCGVDNKPQDGDACAGDTTPRTYCGECGLLSASSYPSDFTTVAPPPSPPVPTPDPAPTPTPAPTPAPSPSPTPTPTPTPGGCTDTNPDEGYCAAVVSLAYCDLIGSDCLKSCGCCDDPSACGAAMSTTEQKLARFKVIQHNAVLV